MEIAPRQRPSAQEYWDPATKGDIPDVRIGPTKLPDPYSMRTSGLVEVGAYCINNLRRSPKVEFHCWKPISGLPKAKKPPKKSKPDRMKLPLYYQSLLDSGVVQTRAELARYLGVSRARVTQVLKRLDNCDSGGEKSKTA